jgi:hypothetical protein
MLIIFALAENLFLKPVTNKGDIPMDNQAKATPRPWQVVTLDGDVYLQIGDGSKKNSGGGLLAKISEPLGADKNANASLIVKAVNSFDYLVNALQVISNDTKISTWLGENDPQALIQVRQAITNATK